MDNGFRLIEVDAQDDQVVAIRIGGEALRSDDGETWFLPKALISADMLVNELPEHATFEICERIEGDVIMMGNIPIRITRIGPDRLRLDFEDAGSPKYWDGAVGFKPYMEAKKAVVEERAAQIGDLTLDQYEDDGAWIHLGYSAETDAERLQSAVQMRMRSLEHALTVTRLNAKQTSIRMTRICAAGCQ